MSLRFTSLRQKVQLPQERIQEPGCHAVANIEDWQRLYGEESRAPVDFGRHVVLAVHRGLCKTGGYRVEIKDVTVASKSQVDVEVDLIDPSSESFNTLAMTYPVDLVRVSRRQLKPGTVTFKFHGLGDLVNNVEDTVVV